MKLSILTFNTFNIFSMNVFLLSTMMAFADVSLVLRQGKQDEDLKRIASYLTKSEELTNYAENAFTSEFTGKLRPIPDELKSELAAYFPEHRFYIAEMSVMIDPPASKYDLILITDTGNTQMKGFIWGNYWTLRPSKSFPLLLRGYKAASEAEAIAKIKTFAKLITYVNNDKIGDSKIRGKKIKVELIRGEGVLGILEVEMRNHLIYEQMTITDSRGKKLKHFL